MEQIYNQVADNGTPVGEELRIETQVNSFLLKLTGQDIPQKIKYDKDGIPIASQCKTTWYILKDHHFLRVFEDKDGCNVDK